MKTYEIPSGCKSVSIGQIDSKIVIKFNPEELNYDDLIRGEIYYCKKQQNYAEHIFRHNNKSSNFSTKINDSFSIGLPYYSSDFQNLIFTKTSQEQQQQFIDNEKEAGFIWNPETFTLDKIRWRAEKGGKYKYLSSLKNENLSTDIYGRVDNECFEIGNYFHPDEDISELKQKFLNLFKEK